ncbi:hypothetical protein Leryth_007034 [Lithospermum erythrorhizon]|nr:hypothetical protein Leryth_007034 [Lithospermum erythrorhizon]
MREIMSSKSYDHHLWCRILGIFLLLLCFNQSFGLNLDGVLLLSFKFSILNDPLGKFVNWDMKDETPCSWNGVICGTSNMSESFNRVVSLALPNSNLLGSLPGNLGMIQYLTFLDLSKNNINGSIPESIFHATELRYLDFSNNMISGELPEFVGCLKKLQVLNLSDNALIGKIPANLTSLHNLTVISLKSNYFFGAIPCGFDSVQVLDVSCNLINGSLPPNIGGNSISYLNVSFNRISGEIHQEFAETFPPTATLDLSFNNFTGGIPKRPIFLKQDSKSFMGNQELYGTPLRNPSPTPSSMSTPSNASSHAEKTNSPPSSCSSNWLKPIIIVTIVIANVALLSFFILVIFYFLYQYKKKIEGNIKKEPESAKECDRASSPGTTEEYNWLRTWPCFGHVDETSSECRYNDIELINARKYQTNRSPQLEDEQKKGELVIFDGEKELELETLLKGSAYVLGASGSCIMYKVVLEDGTILAVRRIGESGVGRFKDFENQVKFIAKLVHPNLVRIHGFYWDVDDKLVIYEFVPNGSLANARHRKAGTSPCHLPWEARLKIAKGVACGLSYIHDKKHVHGNLKPSNILLNEDMEPKLGDFGLERLLMGDNSSKIGWSARNFGSKRSNSFEEFNFGSTPSPSPSGLIVSPYHAPESLRSLKPNQKWDVFFRF